MSMGEVERLLAEGTDGQVELALALSRARRAEESASLALARLLSKPKKAG